MRRLKITDSGRAVLGTLAFTGSYATAWLLGSASQHLAGSLHVACKLAAVAWVFAATAALAYTYNIATKAEEVEA
jgi:hypothetical protein